MKKKSLLIIGGTGFFGKSILDYFVNYVNLKKKIQKIIIISRKNCRLDILDIIKKNYEFKKINEDILTLKKFPDADYIIYCALLKNLKKDHFALKKFIHIAKKKYKKSKILYISSGAVYGKQPTNIKKIKESYFDLKKINYYKNGYKKEYSILKKKNEKSFSELKNYGIKISIARCFAFVGRFLPRNSNYVVGNFIENVLKNQDLFIRSDYRIFRSYMYADDLSRWLIKIVENADEKCPIYNVGSDDLISIQKLGNILAKKNNLHCLIKKNYNKNYDLYVPNTNKIRKKLKLYTKFSSIEAVNKTIELLKNEK
jgi:nucleoside-diphosphate-sugar epimerase